MTIRRVQQTPRQIMDPHRTLPEVSLIPDPEGRASKGTWVAEPLLITTIGRTVGKATLVHDRKTHEAWFNGIRITDEALRRERRGYGLGAYLWAIESLDGETFRTHRYSQTDSAVNRWQKFVDAGVAILEEPFVPTGEMTPDGTQKLYDGYAYIPPTSKG